jgi:hypothetical protein
MVCSSVQVSTGTFAEVVEDVADSVTLCAEDVGLPRTEELANVRELVGLLTPMVLKLDA